MILWRRVFVRSAVIALLVVAFGAVPAVSKYLEIQRWEDAQRPDPRPADAEQWTAIFQGLMRSNHFRSHLPTEPPDPAGTMSGQLRLPVRLVDSTVILCEYFETPAEYDPPCPVAAKAKWDVRHAHRNDAIPEKLRRELILANRVPVSVPASVGSAFQRISRDEFGALNESEWSDTALQTAQPVISQDGRFAAVYVETPECCMWGGGYFYFLEHRPSGWKVNLPE